MAARARDYREINWFEWLVRGEAPRRDSSDKSEILFSQKAEKNVLKRQRPETDLETCTSNTTTREILKWDFEWEGAREVSFGWGRRAARALVCVFNTCEIDRTTEADWTREESEQHTDRGRTSSVVAFLCLSPSWRNRWHKYSRVRLITCVYGSRSDSDPELKLHLHSFDTLVAVYFWIVSENEK